MPPRDLVRAQFPRLDAGYESWFLRAANPSGRCGFWIRYTIRCSPGRSPRGSLWCTYFDADAPTPAAAKVTTDGPREDPGAWVRIGDAVVGPLGAHGVIADAPSGPMRWDLTFEGADLFAHLPRAWMYGAPLPRTKPVSVHPAARFAGTLALGDQVVDVDGWRGTVGHNWGTEHAERWIWLHCTGFEGDEDAWLDVVLARLRVGPWTTPWSGFGGLGLAGRRHRLGGLTRGRSTDVEEHPDRLAFTLTGRVLEVTGRVGAPPERFVGWVYADPDGSGHDVVHCSVADLNLTVRQKGQPVRTLVARGMAAYELGMREHDHGVPIQPFPDA
ncbi:MAG: hypothetical protein ABI873_10740 [Marmoricola sp.]